MTDAFKTALWTSVFLFFGILLVHTALYPALETETSQLAADIPALRSCLTSGESCRNVSHAPLLQQLPQLGLYLSGVRVPGLPIAMLWITIFSAIGTVVWAFIWSVVAKERFQSDQTLTAWMVLLLLTGQIIVYYGTTFSDGLLGILTVLLLFAMLSEKKILPFVFSLFLSIGKTFAAPLTLLFVVSCWLLVPNKKKSSFISASFGVFTGASLVIWFNYLRYNAPINVFFLSPVFMVDSSERAWSQGLATLLSPSGGLIYFATGLILLCGFGFRATTEKLKVSEKAAIILAVIVPILTFVAGSLYQDPVNADSWGNRNAMPWVTGACAVAGIAFLRRGAFSSLSSQSKYLLPVFLGIFNLPHLFAAADRSVIDITSFPASFCGRSADVLANRTQYFQCMQSYLWQKRSLPLQSLKLGAPDITGWLLILTGSVIAITATWILLAPPKTGRL